ncbi:probable 39S ribosomal protein L45, mitochondrial [Haliotis rubra]|uniref:probable 39S ribosomal protein L45, mitochondrial n=1 Tax=Haliotis rubra TaxID=36100 RepID=UPI001EE562A2|nr:probable 39S ribosomal protein L45, mitochondrial [Haliotis rubra]XP_046570351.1 probable 39S ribosomal protein L45, mitochondrial [Haliotis rubra]
MAAHISRLVRIGCHQKILSCQVVSRCSVPVISQCAPAVCVLQVRYPSSKHFNPKFRKLRRKKVMKIDLPDYGKVMKDRNMSADEKHKQMKEDKIPPPRIFQERPINISCTSAIFEPFVPPEGDGKSSFLSTEGVKQKYTEFEKKGKSFMALRKVRQFEDDFDTKDFAQQAQDILMEAQKCLEDVRGNKNRLHELVSEKGYVEMVFGLENKTFRWGFVESIEPPRVTHVRTTEVLGKDNLYAQVTVRMHTKQILAIYDRFGRLMYGSETIPKDCLEYVVFEKHIANVYGQWRVHGKIIPDWMPPREPLIKTYRVPKFEPLEELEEDTSSSTSVEKQDKGTSVQTAA